MLIPRLGVKTSNNAASKTGNEPAAERTWRGVRQANV